MLKTQLCEPRQVSVREWLGLPIKTGERIAYSTLLIGVTAVYLAIGVTAFAVYSFTRNPAWVDDFFRIPGAMLAVVLAIVQLWLSVQVLRHFSSDEPMHAVWLCIAGSAAFDFAGVTASQVLAADSVLNPLVNFSWWSPQRAIALRQFGLLLGGT